MACVLCISMSWMSMSNDSPWRRLSSVWCHTCASAESWMWFRSCLQRLHAIIGLLRHAMDSWVEVCCAPAKMKANCNCEAVEVGSEQNTISQIHDGKVLPVADQMESVISIILGMQASLARIMTRRRWKSPVRHHSFFPSLTTGPIVLLNGETVGITTPSLKASCIWVSVLGPILIYIGQYELFYSWSREESQGSPIFPSQF